METKKSLIFYKYQGTGNDFVMVDNRNDIFPKSDTEFVAHLCHRRFGIGADGLILLENDPTLDFKMVYYNADGNEGSMCGNGGRCLVAFANFLGVIASEAKFNAVDGEHSATVEAGIVELKMGDVTEIKTKPNAYFLDTGSPHHVQLVNELQNLDVFKEGSRLRYGLYGEKGSNINFVESIGNGAFAVRTYERGVEDETLSCGTGVTATAIAMHKAGKVSANVVDIETQGGNLQVRFTVDTTGYSNVYLKGPATQVFKGEIQW
ncbi:diaminopimelate epimerase [Maribacter polysaccharolyticus]|uniref:diaminopimelate epimerase n=1 Tax=Maribacter polysaccharolyticus TaxID=3020831 RepID=UPI00237F4F07|nr:diaminopimelate epimerase [Maribacter polysaccharolyticus]MDE3740681.1 diaminopimelate epimerase [Maribacter polysaccharolyticus]